MPSHRALIFVSLMSLTGLGCARGMVVPDGAGTDFDPIAFFEGRTHGDGHLKKLFGAPIPVTVDSVGRIENGTLILDQTIREGKKPPTVRRWTIRRVTRDQFTGTLTEAVGEVRATVAGPRAEIHYTMRHGLSVQQRLAQQSGGTTILNRLVVHYLGVKVATLSETIRRVP